MKFEDLITLIDKLDQSSIAYLDYTQDADRVLLSKEVPQFSTATQPEENQPNQSVSKVTVETSTETGKESVESSPAKDDSEAIVAPMIGVVYLQENPDAEPYVNVGDHVNKGDVVCIIEAMKLMNEIQSPVSGIVKEILVNNEDVVEFNQPLIRVE